MNAIQTIIIYKFLYFLEKGVVIENFGNERVSILALNNLIN
jgi:hypothetical protein